MSKLAPNLPLIRICMLTIFVTYQRSNSEVGVPLPARLSEGRGVNGHSGKWCVGTKIHAGQCKKPASELVESGTVGDKVSLNISEWRRHPSLKARPGVQGSSSAISRLASSDTKITMWRFIAVENLLPQVLLLPPKVCFRVRPTEFPGQSHLASLQQWHPRGQYFEFPEVKPTLILPLSHSYFNSILIKCQTKF